ncbi:uncharacterized protein RVIR1_08720 [Candidatus Rickettsiella viridis]|uniref:Uncharacterized protein n=1 Tax=Candidatus Rickettsiella viridis TaxID=676208 RepID=A0A2Z5UWB1_9COXI|nr:hypothetical protein [Candidatus Rickettsiella viridis]BBB15355.1 uncharacterized protein RVIR1_08720 [Candidatus Rickettsiella viridis]
MAVLTKIGSKNTREAVRLINASCRLMAGEEEHDPVTAVIKLTPQDLEQLINKIMRTLPARQFDNATPLLRQDILSFIAKNFIFFAAQEDIHSAHSQYHLINFIACLSDQIDTRYYPNLFKSE